MCVPDRSPRSSRSAESNAAATATAVDKARRPRDIPEHREHLHEDSLKTPAASLGDGTANVPAQILLEPSGVVIRNMPRVGHTIGFDRRSLLHHSAGSNGRLFGLERFGAAERLRPASSRFTTLTHDSALLLSIPNTCAPRK